MQNDSLEMMHRAMKILDNTNSDVYSSNKLAIEKAKALIMVGILIEINNLRDSLTKEIKKIVLALEGE